MRALRILRQLCRWSAALTIGLAAVAPLILWLAPAAVAGWMPAFMTALTAGEAWAAALLGLGFLLLLSSGAAVFVISNRLPKRLEADGGAVRRELRLLLVASLPALVLGVLGIPFLLSIVNVAGPLNLVYGSLFCACAVAVPALCVWIPIHFGNELNQTLGAPFAEESPAEQAWESIRRGVLIGMEKTPSEPSE